MSSSKPVKIPSLLIIYKRQDNAIINFKKEMNCCIRKNNRMQGFEFMMKKKQERHIFGSLVQIILEHNYCTEFSQSKRQDVNLVSVRSGDLI